MAFARNLTLAALPLLAMLAALAAASAHPAAPPAVSPSAVAVAVMPDGGGASVGGRITLDQPVSDASGRPIRSLLDVRGPMSFGSYVWDDRGVPAGEVWVRVDLGKQLISVFRGGHEIGTAVILYGGDGKDTPVGEFPVLQKVVDYHSRTYDAPMPYMMRLTADGVAIHASDVRAGWATHGCVGVPPAFARLLYGQVGVGDQVVITGA